MESLAVDVHHGWSILIAVTIVGSMTFLVSRFNKRVYTQIFVVCLFRPAKQRGVLFNVLVMLEALVWFSICFGIGLSCAELVKFLDTLIYGGAR